MFSEEYQLRSLRLLNNTFKIIINCYCFWIILFTNVLFILLCFPLLFYCVFLLLETRKCVYPSLLYHARFVFSQHSELYLLCIFHFFFRSQCGYPICTYLISNKNLQVKISHTKITKAQSLCISTNNYIVRRAC